MRNLEIAYILAVPQGSQLPWFSHITFLHLQICFPLISSFLFSFFFSFSNKNYYHKQADEYSLQHVIHRRELASLCHEGALDILK